MLSLRLGERTERFRLEFARWLESNPPPRSSVHGDLNRFVEVSRHWQARLAGERWIGVHWPECFGGRGLTLIEEAVSQELLAAANSPQLINLFGLTMVGPVLLKHGSEAQKARFLKRILSAEEIWCQGFSEPDAGSDLASLRTTATQRSDGSWTISGQKVWTGFAQYADWCFLLARSDNSAPKHKGLSYFLVEMKQPGIQVRPLEQITGEREFNEVFFDTVPVPGEQLVGAPGQGWEIAITTLMYERAILTFGRFLQSAKVLEEIRRVLKRQGGGSAELRSFGELYARSLATHALALSHLAAYADGVSPGPEGSLDKLGWSELFQRICEFGFDVSGGQGGEFAYEYLYSRGRTIAAGTSEIQRNIIAERILGLPRKE